MGKMKVNKTLNRRLNQIVASSILMLFLIVISTFTVSAAETILYKANTLQETTDITQVMEEAEDTAAVIGTLEAGTPVIVMEDCTGEWCKIRYQGLKGYIHTEALAGFGEHIQIEGETQAEEQNTTGNNFEEAMRLEFEEMAAANHRGLDEYEHNRKNRIHAIIFGSIMVLIVIAMFATGIVSAIRKNHARLDKGEQ